MIRRQTCAAAARTHALLSLGFCTAESHHCHECPISSRHATPGHDSTAIQLLSFCAPGVHIDEHGAAYTPPTPAP